MLYFIFGSLILMWLIYVLYNQFSSKANDSTWNAQHIYFVGFIILFGIKFLLAENNM